MRRTALAAFAVTLAVNPLLAADPDFYVDQGQTWTAAARMDFYTRDQGSRMIPLAWLLALKRSDGQPFLADGLTRYGYLPNPDSANGLPIGFHASGPAGF